MSRVVVFEHLTLDGVIRRHRAAQRNPTPRRRKETRALAHGVPLLMLPLRRDQHINAERVVQPAPASISRLMRQENGSGARSRI